MPRPNQHRSGASEDAVAARVRVEREARGWSYADVAREMGRAGCPINQSAIYKIENAKPRRRITVDELVGFSQVFEVSVEDLMLAPQIGEGAAMLRTASWSLESSHSKIVEALEDLQRKRENLAFAINKAEKLNSGQELTADIAEARKDLAELNYASAVKAWGTEMEADQAAEDVFRDAYIRPDDQPTIVG